MSTELALVKNQAFLMPSSGEWTQMQQMAEVLVKSGFLPQSIKTSAAAVTIMLKGRELGIPPMQAFAKISVINGKPAMDAELMLSLIYRTYPDADIDIVENTDSGATVQARRSRDRKYARFTFNREDAQRAGLLGKGPWQNYPKAMYLWRATSMMARAVYPECLMGVSHTPEELGANVDGDGQVIDIQPEPPKREEPKAVPREEPPRSEPPPKAEKPEPGLYDGSAGHADVLEAALKKRGVRLELWQAVGDKLIGRPMSVKVLDEVIAAAEAEAP